LLLNCCKFQTSPSPRPPPPHFPISHSLAAFPPLHIHLLPPSPPQKKIKTALYILSFLLSLLAYSLSAPQSMYFYLSFLTSYFFFSLYGSPPNLFLYPFSHIAPFNPFPLSLFPLHPVYHFFILLLSRIFFSSFVFPPSIPLPPFFALFLPSVLSSPQSFFTFSIFLCSFSVVRSLSQIYAKTGTFFCLDMGEKAAEVSPRDMGHLSVKL
jgi:hypothetical protein